MLAHIIFSLPITTYYSPIPNVNAIVDTLGYQRHNGYETHNSGTYRHLYQQDAIDNIITYITNADRRVIYKLLIYTQSPKVMDYITSIYTYDELVIIVREVLILGYPNRYVVTYLNTKIYDQLSQIDELVGIYPDLYNTPIDRCIECPDDIAGEYVLRCYTDKKALSILKLLQYRCSRKLLLRFIVKLHKDTPNLDNIVNTLHHQGFTLNIRK